jgi:hypothetical protein
MGEGFTQATTATLAASLAVTAADVKKVSQRTTSYTTEEDKLQCRGWMDISQDPLCGAEKNDWHIGGGWANILPSIVIENISPLQRDGASSMQNVASSKAHSKR